MTMTISSTTKIVKLNGIDCRVWEGSTAGGVKVYCFILCVAAEDGQDLSRFEAELQEQAVPSIEIEALPLRFLVLIP